MLKCNWHTTAFEYHGGSFSSILRWLLTRAGGFAVPAMTDISHYWRWSKRLTGHLLIQLPFMPVSPQFPYSVNFPPLIWLSSFSFFFLLFFSSFRFFHCFYFSSFISFFFFCCFSLFFFVVKFFLSSLNLLLLHRWHNFIEI